MTVMPAIFLDAVILFFCILAYAQVVHYGKNNYHNPNFVGRNLSLRIVSYGIKCKADVNMQFFWLHLCMHIGLLFHELFLDESMDFPNILSFTNMYNYSIDFPTFLLQDCPVLHEIQENK